MAAVAIRFHPAAGQEPEAAYDWYAARNQSVAHGFREELRHTVTSVAENPDTWPRYGSRARRYVFPRFPFSLVYVLQDDTVEIIAVAHGRRRPGYWQWDLYFRKQLGDPEMRGLIEEEIVSLRVGTQIAGMRQKRA